MASVAFQTMFAIATTAAGTATKTVFPLPDDDGDAVYILCNILHLRNDKLPTNLMPDLLCKLALLCKKYQCVVAAGRATLQWFDRLHASKDPGDLWKIIEAAYLLDEPMFFARFTARWVLQQPIFQRQMPGGTTSDTQGLAGRSPS